VAEILDHPRVGNAVAVAVGGEFEVIRNDTRRWVPWVERWAENVANGRDDRRETLIHAKFGEGGTIGPVT